MLSNAFEQADEVQGTNIPNDEIQRASRVQEILWGNGKDQPGYIPEIMRSTSYEEALAKLTQYQIELDRKWDSTNDTAYRIAGKTLFVTRARLHKYNDANEGIDVPEVPAAEPAQP